MTTYLITGAKGQVGSQLVQQLQAQPSAIVIATDRNTLDITNRAAVFQVCPNPPPRHHHQRRRPHRR